MLREQFLHQWNEFRILPSHGKEVLFFRRKVMLNLEREVLLDFNLPRLHFARGRQRRAVDSYAQCECMLVLAGEWNQAFVAKHAPIMR